MEKSNKLTSVAILALVFVVYNFMIGSETALADTVKSIILVGVATVLTHLVIREQRKKGRLSMEQ